MLGLGRLISDLPDELGRYEIIQHIGPLGMMIARHVLLGNEIECCGFEYERDIYQNGLEFFVWCFKNIVIYEIELNTRRFGTSTIKKWLCEYWFKSLEPDYDARDQLIHTLHKIITIDHRTKPFVVVLRTVLHHSKLERIYYMLQKLLSNETIYFPPGLDKLDWIMHYTAHKKERRGVIITNQDSIGSADVGLFIEATKQTNATGFVYILKVDKTHELKPDDAMCIISETNEMDFLNGFDMEDSVWFERYIIDYCE